MQVDLGLQVPRAGAGRPRERVLQGDPSREPGPGAVGWRGGARAARTQEGPRGHSAGLGHRPGAARSRSVRTGASSARAAPGEPDLDSCWTHAAGLHVRSRGPSAGAAGRLTHRVPRRRRPLTPPSRTRSPARPGPRARTVTSHVSPPAAGGRRAHCRRRRMRSSGALWRLRGFPGPGDVFVRPHCVSGARVTDKMVPPVQVSPLIKVNGGSRPLGCAWAPRCDLVRLPPRPQPRGAPRSPLPGPPAASDRPLPAALPLLRPVPRRDLRSQAPQ